MKLVNTTKEYKRSNSMVYSCQYHVIFTTKYRRKVLEGDIADSMKEIILDKQSDYSYEIIEFEVMSDHVSVNPEIGVHKAIRKLKGYSSRALRDNFPSLVSRLPCLWTRSKFVTTVGDVSLSSIQNYIQEQKGK